MLRRNIDGRKKKNFNSLIVPLSKRQRYEMALYGTLCVRQRYEMALYGTLCVALRAAAVRKNGGNKKKLRQTHRADDPAKRWEEALYGTLCVAFRRSQVRKKPDT